MDVIKLITLLRRTTKKFTRPLSDMIVEEFGKDPYLILISCLLSLRARDTTTIQVCRDLFAHAKTPKEIIELPLKNLEKIIFPIGFYKHKAKTLKYVTRVLLERFKGKVPRTEEELLSIKGVGQKTANLVLGVAFGIPAICVDVHVHRISNRLGLIKTKNVEETEQALQKIIPKHYWIEWNRLIVMWGQNVCVPLSPFCSTCAIRSFCSRIGVTRSR